MNLYPPVPKSRAITVGAAAKRLDVNPKTIYRAIARGELAAVRVGRSIRISELVLERLIAPTTEETR